MSSRSKRPKLNKKRNQNGYRYKSHNVNEDTKESEEDNNTNSVRIWVCSWNMAAKEHFKFKVSADGTKIPDDDITAKFEQIVPTNYDLYIFGVQEGVNDNFFSYISLYLGEFDVQRIPLTNKNEKSKKSMNKNAACFGVHGRGDGSFFSTKFTGIAVYYRRALSSYITLRSSCAVSCGITQGSKGAACVLLKIYSSTIAFLSTHMSSNSTDAKLEHFKILVNKAGDQLGCSGFDLLQQFHHIVWFGDLNYRITALNADSVLQKMALGNLSEIWKADSLHHEFRTRKQCAFKNFLEPKPRLDFYPTYKKKPNRQLDFDQNPKQLSKQSASSQQSSLSQLDKIYATKYKEPFYKGGLIQDRIPSFCDRVLLHSLCDGLNPETDSGVLNCVEFSYKKDKCNNYGCIPHHLMGSDHSAIYCGLTLKSRILFPCPPHELNDQGLPKSYQLRIEDIKIVKKSPYHSGSTYCETPLKSKICFPAPFEIENFKYKHHKPFHYTIFQQDLDMYHYILRQIDAESKRRVARQKNKQKDANPPKTHPLITPQISSTKVNIAQKQVVDMLDIMDTNNSENENYNNDKTKTKNKKQSRARSVASFHHSKIKHTPKRQNMTIPKMSEISKRRDSAPPTKKHETPSDYIFISEQAQQMQNNNDNNNDDDNNAEFTFSFDYNKNHTFNLSQSNETESNVKNETEFAQLDDFNSNSIQRQKSDPTPTSKSIEARRKSLHRSIVDDNYFEPLKNEPNINTMDTIQDNEITEGTDAEDMMPRTRSKSMGSYAETSDAPANNKKGNTSNNTKDDSKSGVNLDQIAKHNELLSPIYKDLADFSKKLTLVSFGPSRRPTDGNIHCVFKVETNDLKGQCCIAIDWNDFAKNVENIQTAELFHHGIALYDKTGAPILLKVHYKVSLIDKQIVFDYH